MSNEVYDFNIGHSTAYAYAKASGDLPEGMTPEEYGELLASYATVGQTAVTAAQTATTKASEAATSATTATNKASEATTAATTATNKAAEAQADADAAALDASQALSAASTATSKATEATTAAATATSAKTDAVAANTAAQSAKTAAQTAQTGAETAAASVSASAAQIATNAEDISQLKSDLSVAYEKAKKYRVYAEGTITDGYIKQTNLSDYAQSSGMYLTALVTGGDTYYVSGTSVSTSFPLMIMVDSNESVIGSVYTSNNNKVDDKEITIPDNCVKVYINGRIEGAAGANYPSIYKYAYSNDIMAEIVDDVQKKQSISYTWEKAESEKVADSFVYLSSGKLNFRTSGGYVYHKIAYDPSKIYRFWGGCYATNIPAVVCCDSSDRIIKLYGTTEGEVYKGQIITDIPQTTQRIYVNGKNSINGVDVATERSVISFASQKIGVALGDSITQGANVYVSNTITPYKDYPTIASEQLGCKIYNGGLGGGTYSAGRSIDFVNVANCVVTGDYTSIIEGIDQYSLNQSAKVQYADIAALDFNEVDFITLSYGTNDWNFGQTISTITAAMINGISAILTAYPHLKIYVFTPIFRFNVGGSGQNSDTYVNATSGVTLPQICEAIKACANDLCLPCKDMYHESNINPYTKVLYMGDDTHPNANGYAVMGEKVARFINSH